jgi:hypothetical protein
LQFLDGGDEFAHGHAGMNDPVDLNHRRQGALTETGHRSNRTEMILRRHGIRLVFPETGDTELFERPVQKFEGTACMTGGSPAHDNRVKTLRLEIEKGIKRRDRVNLRERYPEPGGDLPERRFRQILEPFKLLGPLKNAQERSWFSFISLDEFRDSGRMIFLPWFVVLFLSLRVRHAASWEPMRREMPDKRPLKCSSKPVEKLRSPLCLLQRSTNKVRGTIFVLPCSIYHFSYLSRKKYLLVLIDSRQTEKDKKGIHISIKKYLLNCYEYKRLKKIKRWKVVITGYGIFTL